MTNDKFVIGIDRHSRIQSTVRAGTRRSRYRMWRCRGCIGAVCVRRNKKVRRRWSSERTKVMKYISCILYCKDGDMSSKGD